MSSFKRMESAIFKKANGKQCLDMSVLLINLLFRSYSNMDYVFASVLRHVDPKLPKVASYDIACQWSIHLLKRVKNLPPLVRLHAILRLSFLIPKLHIYGHKLRCQTSYSFHLCPGVGNTDGEGIERSHAFIGPFGTSTKEMGPGSRHDTLDDAWGYWNWLKLISICMSYPLLFDRPNLFFHQRAYLRGGLTLQRASVMLN